MEINREVKRDPASFRDPVSRVYSGDGMVFRQVEASYFPEYDHLMQSGLYQELVDEDLLIPHRQSYRDQHFMMLHPEQVPMITYPFEWSFAHLQEAALVTLRINQIAMQHGMMLKDASAYNIQIYQDRMCLIDTCSFIRYSPGMPWGSYAQFLRHFLCPMVLIKYFNPYTALKLLQTNIDGIPVPLAARLMPLSTRFSMGMWAHIFSQSLRFAIDPKRPIRMNQVVLESLLSNLTSFVAGMTYKPPAGDLLKYAEGGSYSRESLASKKYIVNGLIGQIKDQSILDLGCNTGDYSRMAAEVGKVGKQVISIDADHDCIFALHDYCGVIPLVVDLCQPSPAIGWANRERKSFWDRVGRVDCILALAIIHHLCLKNNVPLDMVADLFADHARSLIIEWVPPDDPKAQILLGQKKVPVYNQDTFLQAFKKHYVIESTIPIQGSGRIIYFMEGVYHAGNT